MDSIGSSLNGWMDKGWKERMARLEKEVCSSSHYLVLECGLLRLGRVENSATRPE